MKGRKKKWALALGIVLAFMALLAYGILYPSPRDIATEEVEFQKSAQDLALEMSQETSARKFADRVVLTWGKIAELRGRRIVLEHGVEALMLDQVEFTQGVGDSIVIKARCVGYDELLEVVRLNQASIIPMEKDR